MKRRELILASGALGALAASRAGAQAKALGIEVSGSVLIRADEVIQ